MALPPSEHIRPLQFAANQYLQVLLPYFQLEREQNGLRLRVAFENSTPAIWSRHGRRAVFESISNLASEAARHQTRIDEVIHGNRTSLMFREPDFPFRFASGGTLPVIRFAGRDYFCLFYRQIHPIGWNIANGGCSSTWELMDPRRALERELHEELLIVDPRQKARYVLDPGNLEIPAGLASGLRSIAERVPAISDLESYSAFDTPIQWIGGPDRLEVRFGARPAVEIDGVFVSLTAEDLSIELDRVAKINIDDDAVIVHGEMIDDEFVDSPVGLFDIDRLDRELETAPRGTRRLVPDVLFHNGQRFEGGQIQSRIDDHFIPWISRFIGENELRAFEDAKRLGRSLDLCPITESVVRRTRSARQFVPAGPRATDAFVSFASASLPRARKIRDYVTESLGMNVFFYDDSFESDFRRAIDNALDQARYLIVYAERAADVQYPGYVYYEWQSFQDDIFRNRRPDLKLITLAAGIDPNDLPRGLRSPNQVIAADPAHLELALNKLGAFLR